MLAQLSWDLLCEIITHLDTQGIFNLRRTCKFKDRFTEEQLLPLLRARLKSPFTNTELYNFTQLQRLAHERYLTDTPKKLAILPIGNSGNVMLELSKDGSLYTDMVGYTFTCGPVKKLVHHGVGNFLLLSLDQHLFALGNNSGSRFGVPKRDLSYTSITARVPCPNQLVDMSLEQHYSLLLDYHGQVYLNGWVNIYDSVQRSRIQEPIPEWKDVIKIDTNSGYFIALHSTGQVSLMIYASYNLTFPFTNMVDICAGRGQFLCLSSVGDVYSYNINSGKYVQLPVSRVVHCLIVSKFFLFTTRTCEIYLGLLEEDKLSLRLVSELKAAIAYLSKSDSLSRVVLLTRGGEQYHIYISQLGIEPGISYTIHQL